MFALIMGSNFGANLTLIGALAGLMWHKIAQSKGVNIKFTEFAKYGIIVMPTVMISSFLILFLEILIFFP
jgi:arsenical pump membrane protein